MSDGEVAKRQLADVKINLDFFIHCLCFLSVLLIGADRWGMDLLGVNVRVDQIFLCILTVLLAVKGEYRLSKNIWALSFVGVSFLSTLFSVSFARGILFFVSILYNVVFLFYAIASYVKAYGLEAFIKIWRLTCYAQFCILLLQFVLEIGFGYELPMLENYGYYMGIPRFRIWFYEPSYLATYLIFWFAFSAYMFLICKDKDYLKDVILGLLMLIMSTSTSGFVGVALVVFSVYLMWLARGINLKKLSFLLLIPCIFLLFRLVFRDLYDVFIARLFGGSLDSATGGRLSGWMETIAVFNAHPILGVGPGCYGIYLGQDAGYVATNVTLELLATLGIFGCIAFYGLSISLIVESFKIRNRERTREGSVLVALSYALILYTIILQVNQGYLRLYHWMFFGMIWGGILCVKRSNIGNNMGKGR